MIRTSQTENSQGRLQVYVYDKTVATPINGAIITISDLQGEEISTLTTDISGKSDTAVLSAPPLDYSQSPNMPSPYSQYNIFIRADGFESVLIDGVQILSGQIAIQNVFMTPSAETPNTEEDINIPAHNLNSDNPQKIPEEEVKELPSETGFIVLDDVVIPEYIVVHTGSPNDETAPNYYIPFKDYIKNVASSEIYSSWPDAAIRANVLCIISFTLNRVFTEWYRNKGKNFTITNSTAYDQFFVYGRNIFEEISQVVDEMFTTYIKRFGSRQPLLAQYCDGARVSCPGWLTQWGAKDLADQGYDTISILRYFYGDDIYLENAIKVSGVPVSFPGEVLQNGSTGNAVRTIQTQLNSISNRYPAIFKLTVDGIYGDSTTEAVEIFQGIFDLPQSGIVDFSTWYQISQIYVAVEKIAEI